MAYWLGIDLGTTYTAAAVSRLTDGRARAEIVTLGDRATQIPSVLHLSPDGTVLVGDAAERRVVAEPDRVVREFKRQVGDLTPIVVDGAPHTAHELMAVLVERVVDQVTRRQGGRPERIAVTHPATWGPHKLDLLRAALQGRSLAVEFLDEPRAAALSYAAAERVEPGSTVAVYDLGGGTFDAAVVRRNGGFTMLGRPEGIERLGGVDFDDAVFTHVREAVGDALDELDPAEEEVLAAVARLRRDCVEAKEALSADTEVRIPVLLPGLRTTVRLVRGEFEEMIRDDVEASVDALRRAVTAAGVEPADLTAVLLVGGSSRIPLVAQLVSAGLDRPVAVDADPKNAIALGAALSVAPQANRVDARPPAGGVPGPRTAAETGAMAPAGPPTGPLPRPPGPPTGPPPRPAGPPTGPPPRAAGPPTGPLPRSTDPVRPGSGLAAAAALPGGPATASLGPPTGRTAVQPATTAPPPGRQGNVPLPRRPVDLDRTTVVAPASRPLGSLPRVALERARRPVGIYVGAGGVLVAAGLVAALLFWPARATPTPTPAGSSVTTTTVTEQVAPSPVSVPVEAPAATGAAAPPRRSGSGGGGGGKAPARRDDPPVVVHTSTVTATATRTTPPTTSSSPTTSNTPVVTDPPEPPASPVVDVDPPVVATP